MLVFLFTEYILLDLNWYTY